MARSTPKGVSALLFDLECNLSPSPVIAIAGPALTTAFLFAFAQMTSLLLALYSSMTVAGMSSLPQLAVELPRILGPLAMSLLNEYTTVVSTFFPIIPIYPQYTTVVSIFFPIILII